MAGPDERDDTLSPLRPDDPATLDRRVGLHRLLGAVLGDARPLPRVGRWIVERRVGQGGMGAVYRGRDPDTGGPVAIKTVPRSGDRARFAAEARTLAALAAPGIVRYLDHGETEEGTAFLVMEWLEGEDLAARLRGGRLPIATATDVGRQVAAALDVAHRAGVVHRDVKPSNVFLTPDGAARVVDFGIARSGEEQTRLTLTGEVVGTPAYMAPEQLRGQHDARTDVYGLGATLYEALTGRPPFPAGAAGAVITAVLTEAVTPPSAHRPELPPTLDLLVTRMLAKDPDARPADMRAVWTELDALEARPTPVLSLAERPVRARSGPVPVADPLLLGRAWERGVLAAALAAAEDESALVVVRVTGPRGAGRTALVEDLAPPSWTAWRGRGTTGAPFSLLSAWCAGDPALAAVEQALASLARAVDPGPAADRVRVAWLGAVGERLDAGPLLVVIDDADRADVGSLRLLAAATRAWPDRGWAVVTTAVDGLGVLHDAPAARQVALPLAPLSPRSATRLVRRLAPDAPADAVHAAVVAAGGVPGLLRAAAHALGTGDRPALGHLLPDGTDALQRWEPEDRRLLRAAALVGEAAWVGAVALLLGVPPDDPALARRLARLEAAGVVRRAARSRVAGDVELTFADDAVRAAALDRCAEEERDRAHRALAGWWRDVGAPPDASWAVHLEGAGDRPAACRAWLAVARAAIAAGDEDAAAPALDRAAAIAPGPSERAEVEVTRAAAAFWAGALGPAGAAAEAAIAALEARPADGVAGDAAAASAAPPNPSAPLDAGRPPEGAAADAAAASAAPPNPSALLDAGRPPEGADATAASAAPPNPPAPAGAAADATAASAAPPNHPDPLDAGRRPHPTPASAVARTSAPARAGDDPRPDADAAPAGRGAPGTEPATADGLRGGQDRLWFDAHSLRLTIAGQQGRADAVHQAAARIASAIPRDGRAADARATGLGRALTQLGTAGPPPAPLLAAHAALDPAALGPDARAWWWRARSVLAAPAFDPTGEAFVAAHRAHLEAGDPRAAAQVGLYLGSLYVWTGAWDRAHAVTDDALTTARRLGAAYLETWGRYVEGKRLAETAPWLDATSHLDDVVERAAGSPRIQAGAWLWSAVAALRAGAWDDAARRAERAAAAHHAAAVRVPALAAAAWARIEAGQPDVAPPPDAAELPTEPVEHAELIALARAAWRRRHGEEDASVLAAARARIEARAATLADPLRRNAYLEGPFLVRAVREVRGDQEGSSVPPPIGTMMEVQPAPSAGRRPG